MIMASVTRTISGIVGKNGNGHSERNGNVYCNGIGIDNRVGNRNANGDGSREGNANGNGIGTGIDNGKD